MAKKGKRTFSSRFLTPLCVFLLASALSCGCFAAEKQAFPTSNLSKEETKKIQKEAKSLGEKGNQTIMNHVKSLSRDKVLLRKTQDSLLSKEEEGKTFDRKEAKESMNAGVFPASEIEEFLTAARTNPPIDESDELFLQAKEVLGSPSPSMTRATETVPEEEILETCEEGGTYARIFEQKLLVTIVPELKESQKVCQGHTQNFISKYPTKNSAKELKKEIKKNIGSNIELLGIEIDERNVTASYRHKNPAILHAVEANKIHTTQLGCLNYKLREQITREREENDTWVLCDGDEKALKSLEDDTDCVLLQLQPSSPGTRTIENTPIYRDAWNRRLVFSCSPNEESKCFRLRNIGATLIKKRCLKTSEEGECLKWEKTFDLGKKASFEKDSIAIDQETLDYLEGFDTSYEKNTEFGQAISTLASFSDMEAFDQGEGSFDSSLVSVFSGDNKKCRRSLNSKHFFDCCYREDKEGRGMVIGLGCTECNQEERDLFLAVSEGKCKKVGKISELFLTQHVYCCFPTKLSRIVQEEGRKQLGLSFGSAKDPQCQGLSFEQLGQIDFEKIDFTEFVEELQDKINTKELAKRFKKLAEDFSRKTTPQNAKNNTSLILEVQEKRLEDLGGKMPENNDAH